MWLFKLHSPCSNILSKRILSTCCQVTAVGGKYRTLAPCGAITKRHQHSYHNPGAADRLQELRQSYKEVYPRVVTDPKYITCRGYNEPVSGVSIQDYGSKSDRYVLRGRVHAIRKAGARLVFIDIVQDGERVQALCNFRNLDGASITIDDFRQCFMKIRRGDHIEIGGYPSHSDSGEPSLSLTSLPTFLSPSLPDLPTKLDDPETKVRLRHLDLLVNRRTASMLRLKSEIIQYIRAFLLDCHHLEVNTPILAASTGGAIARPFDTVASEFLEKKLSLRIAPELWLKRLVIGGFDRVFEIGPSFRNEGVDLTHNPEFTTCEFYTAFASLDDLMKTTEDMLSGLFSHLQGIASIAEVLEAPSSATFAGPYPRIDFIPHVEAALGKTLPDLSDTDALEKVASLMKDAELEVPAQASLPQLLDRLSTEFIEPHCVGPTFIINHPECLSPLAKSFQHPDCNQMVAARAELFVKGFEIINTYEEENSPREQRRKFNDQVRFRGDPEGTPLDESYLEALEWGLPPTGGWGGGIERLCMVMSDSNRISDTLSFGTLRNVVGLGHGAAPRH